jgi:OMF family outer membrane factor
VLDAEHARTRAQLTAGTVANRVRFEVRKRWLEAKANFENLASAQTQLSTAEEAFRLQRVKFDAAAATTTDVLDAETDVARSRLQSSLARYDYYLSLVSLARAMGDVPAVR